MPDDLTPKARLFHDAWDAWRKSGDADTLSAFSAGFKAVADLIGEPVEGHDPQEWKPRDATWMGERKNWQNETERLRGYIAELEKKIKERLPHEALTLFANASHAANDR